MLQRSGLILFVIMSFLPYLCHAAEVVEPRIKQSEPNHELARYQALARIQANSANHLATFTTDGCSGGLSDGWRFLARALPIFKQKFGDKPPYEGCCVVHDRAYWRGETKNGYAKRLHADQTLQQCVAEYGRTHRDSFAREFHLTPESIESNFKIVATLMYRAVRIGGQPCTLFPWRWGYGWPRCQEQDE